MKFFVFLYCLLIVTVSYSEPSSSSPQIYLSGDWQQGSIGKVFFYPLNKITDIKVELVNNNGVIVCSSEAFPYKLSRKEGGYRVAIALLGFSAQLPSGDYSLNILMSGHKHKHEYSQAVTLLNREYKKSIIKMGPSGTAIATAPRDPERFEQAKRFYEVLNNFDPKAIYDSGMLSLPISKAQWRYSSVYGTSRTFLYSNGQKGYDFHNGQDFAGAPVGTEVEAVLSGKVVMAEQRIVTGGTVIIEHLPKVFTLYYHLDTTLATVGRDVKKGETIGTLGSTGFATGPHLHLSLHVSGYEVDPSLFYDQPLINHAAISNQLKKR